MKTLVVLGAGQYGIVAKETAIATGKYEKIVFLDDNSDIAVGKMADIDKIEYDHAFIAIGNTCVRARLLKEINNLTTLIHPKATVMPSAELGVNCIVEAGAVVCSGAVVKDGCIVMSNAVVGHNAVVESCCQLKYNSTVCDGARVAENTKLECNQTVLKR